MTRTIGFMTTGLLGFALMAAPKVRDWQTGKLTDSHTVDTGVKAKQPHFSVGPSAPPPSNATTTVTTAELVITGTDYIFTCGTPIQRSPAVTSLATTSNTFRTSC